MNRIREARLNAAIKQTDLCARIGISQATLSGWENDKYEPDKDSWIKLSHHLGVTIDYLMGNSSKNITPEEAKNPATQSKIDQIAGLLETADDRFVDDVVAYIKFRKSVQSESE